MVTVAGYYGHSKQYHQPRDQDMGLALSAAVKHVMDIHPPTRDARHLSARLLAPFSHIPY